MISITGQSTMKRQNIVTEKGNHKTLRDELTLASRIGP